MSGPPSIERLEAIESVELNLSAEHAEPVESQHAGVSEKESQVPDMTVMSAAVNSSPQALSARSVTSQNADVAQHVHNSLKMLKVNHPRMYCLQCPNPAGFASKTGRHENGELGFHTKTIPLKRAVTLGCVTQETYAIIERRTGLEDGSCNEASASRCACFRLFGQLSNK